ncbi:YkgJ family cysteine cluster protein [Cohnella pontilimi]|uniref:YkgJ family cysteine cluster protein n=1 Tax=Cohnella pontilimi TaxID=2564100 RepID=A0A4U0FFF4_9BACL|nr:YkgJ family cysteine cluster protein [Cohnella pontilimi]TJY43104.1 YkgJ family cysteine cluster protein [Cohnella pontilimi]
MAPPNSKPFLCDNCIECCANVPVTAKEMQAIEGAIRAMPQEQIDRLQAQKRKDGACPLVDVENKRCAVYEARPWICRLFGYMEQMQCPYNTHIEILPFAEGQKKFMTELGVRSPEDLQAVGVLGQDITWESLVLR